MTAEMLPHLATAASRARVAGGKRPATIAGLADTDQVTITRFEKAKAWPAMGADKMIAAYCKALGIDSLDIWQDALGHLSAEARTAAHWFERRAHRDRRVVEVEPLTLPDRRRRAQS